MNQYWSAALMAARPQKFAVKQTFEICGSLQEIIVIVLGYTAGWLVRDKILPPFNLLNVPMLVCVIFLL